jgi:hypothetical protein
MYEELKEKDIGKDLQDAYNHGLFDGKMLCVECLKTTKKMVLKLDESIANILKFLGCEDERNASV